MEQHVGLATYYLNLRAQVDQMPDIEATWIPVEYRHKLQGNRYANRVVAALAGRREAIRGLKSVDYDVAFVHTQVPATLAQDYLRRKPYVVCTDVTPTLYDSIGHDYGHHESKAGLVRRLKHLANVNMFRRAHTSVLWSQWAADSVKRDYDVTADSVDVVPVGIDRSIWQTTPRHQTQAGPVRLLFIGGDFQRKGGAVLLDAFGGLEAGSAELHVVTKDDVAEQDGVFVYRDIKPNSAELLRLCGESDIFVMPTLADSFGIAFLEAMAAGLPVISTTIAAIPEIVLNGQTGLLVEPGSSTALRAAIEELAGDPERRIAMGELGAQRVAELFDAAVNAERIADICFAAAGRQRAVRS